MRPGIGPLMIIVSRWIENEVKKTAPELRTWTWCDLGAAQGTWIWWNKSTRSLNLKGAIELYKAWQSSKNRQQGRLVLDSEKEIRRFKSDKTVWIEEDIYLSKKESAKWKQITFQTKATHCLYVPPKATEANVYLVSSIAFNC